MFSTPMVDESVPNCSPAHSFISDTMSTVHSSVITETKDIEQPREDVEQTNKLIDAVHENESIDAENNQSETFILLENKRKADDKLEQPKLPKARKSFPASSSSVVVQSSFMKKMFPEFVHKTNRLCKGIEHLENDVEDLQLKNNRYINETNQQKQEISDLKAENIRLTNAMNKLNSQWTASLEAAKKKQWCITCGMQPEMPWHCSRKCQMIYW